MVGVNKDVIRPGALHLLLAILSILSVLHLAGSTPAAASASLGRQLTTVNDVRFTISWVTDSAEIGYVEYGTTTALSNTAYDDRGQGTVAETHHVTVLESLQPDTRYYYDIVSGDQRDDNGGNHYTVTTGPSFETPPPPTHDIWGQVLKSDATTPAEGAIVYITVIADSVSSQELSVLVNQFGWWGVVLGGLRTSDYQDYFNFTDDDEVSLFAEGASDGRDSKSFTVAVAGDVDSVLVLTSEPVVPLTPELPVVQFTSPVGNANGVAIDVNATATFSQHINSSTVTDSTFTLVSDGTSVMGTVTYDNETKTAIFDPAASLVYEATYTATITTEVQSRAGHSLAQDYTWSFSTMAAPPEEPPPAQEPSTPEASDVISSKGVFLKAVALKSTDARAELTVDTGTVSLIEGAPVSGISITELAPENLPDLPQNFSIVGLPYDFKPDGVTFNPPATLTISYDPAEIPEGVSEENLLIALWDTDAGEWVILEGCTVDPATHTISTPVSHFTAFAVLAYTHPDAFRVGSLTISPAEVDIGDTVTISVLVTNAGDVEGTYKVILKIDGAVAGAKDVTLAGGASRKVTFTASKDAAGTYGIDIGDLSGTFTVRTPVPVTELESAKPTRWWLWLIIGLVTVGVVAMVVWRKIYSY